MDPTTETRLLGGLALSESEQVSSVLILKLDSKEIQFKRNIEDPSRIAQLAFTIYTTAAELRDTSKKQPNLRPKSEGANGIPIEQPYGGSRSLIKLEDTANNDGGYASIAAGKYSCVDAWSAHINSLMNSFFKVVKAGRVFIYI